MIAQLNLTHTEIRNNANAIAIRLKETPFIASDTHPVIYTALKKIADKQGKSVEQVQFNACKTIVET